MWSLEPLGDFASSVVIVAVRRLAGSSGFEAQATGASTEEANMMWQGCAVAWMIVWETIGLTVVLSLMWLLLGGQSRRR
jgi:hypothetical protein